MSDVDLHAIVRAQQATIERLEARLARLEGPGGTAARRYHETSRATGDDADHAAEPTVRSPNAASDGDIVTDRRRLLSRAATAAAGAVAGGTAVVLSQATPAAAAQGVFTGDPAVDATAIPLAGVAVNASTTTGTALRGIVSSGTAVVASTSVGTGVLATASTGTTFDGSCSNGTILRADIGVGGTHLLLTTDNVIPPPPASITPRSTGAMVRDSNGDLWLCVSGGTPGLWRRVSGTNTAGALTLLTGPVRVYDSRPGNPPNIGSKTPLANGATRTIDCTLNGSGVPIGAQAVLANVTVVNSSANGFLTAYRNGIAVPAASTINWFQAGTIAANTTVIACDALARIACYVPPTSSTDFFVDIIGYFR